MGDGSLSQDEIDALLQGADDMLSPSGPSQSVESAMGGGPLTATEINTLRDILGSSMGAVAPSLGGYLGGRNLAISNPAIEVKAHDAVRSDFQMKCVQVAMNFSGSLMGRNLIVFALPDAGAISSLMMGDESGKAPATLSEAHQSTIQEFTNQLLSSAATQFSGRVGGSINATPAVLSMVNSAADLQLPPGADLVKVTYDLSIEGVLNSKLYHIMDIDLATGLSSGGYSSPQPAMHQQAMKPQAGQVGISPVKFPPLDQGIAPSIGGNISLLLDVPMTLTVELGRTTQLVQDILGLGEGSIIELDKLAVYQQVHRFTGKLIAKGEVVVIDENFGVRVTDIVSPVDRLSGLQ